MNPTHEEQQSLRLVKAFRDVKSDRERELLIRLVENAARTGLVPRVEDAPPLGPIRR